MKPPEVGGTPTPVKSKKGITGVSVAFNEPLNPASADNLTLYHVFKGVKKKKKTVYTKVLEIRQVSFNSSSDTVTINLAKPYKGAVEVTVDGAIEALDGTASDIDFSTILK